MNVLQQADYMISFHYFDLKCGFVNGLGFYGKKPNNIEKNKTKCLIVWFYFFHIICECILLKRWQLSEICLPGDFHLAPKKTIIVQLLHSFSFCVVYSSVLAIFSHLSWQW